MMNSDGTTETRLTNNPAIDLKPAWSPDGKKIAFASNRDGGNFNSFEIYVMDLNGGVVQRLTNNSAADVHPSYSPDGHKIAFHSRRDGNAEVYVMNADGTNQINLTDDSADDVQPAFSPDGNKIAFQSDRDHPSGEIYVMFFEVRSQSVSPTTLRSSLTPTGSRSLILLAPSAEPGAMTSCVAHRKMT